MTIVRIGAPRSVTPGYTRGVKTVYEDSRISLFDMIQMLSPIYDTFRGEDPTPPMSFHMASTGDHNYGVQIEFTSDRIAIGHILDELSNHRSDGRMQIWKDNTIGVAFPVPDAEYRNIVEQLSRDDFMERRNSRIFHLDGRASIMTNDCDDYIDFVAILRPTSDSIVNLKQTLVLVGVDVTKRIDNRAFAVYRLREADNGSTKSAGYVVDESLRPDPHIVAVDARRIRWAEPEE